MATKWQCHFLAWVTLLITIPGVLAHVVTDTNSVLLLLWLFIPFANVYVGPTLALLQNLVRSDMRATTAAVLLFTANIANLATAPQMIGFASAFLAGQIADPAQSHIGSTSGRGRTGKSVYIPVDHCKIQNKN